MTTSYERLREECNKRLPERLKLKFGCEFQLAWLSSSHLQQGLYKKFRTTKFVYDGQTHLLCEHGWLDFNDMYIMQDKGFWKILGAPLTITDVLRVLRTVEDAYSSYFLHSNGWLMWEEAKYRGKDVPNVITKQICLLNLSLPLSATENEAACEAIYKLIIG